MRNRPNHNNAPSSSRGYLAGAIIFTLMALGAFLYINRQNIREFSDTYKSREQAKEKIAQTKQLIAKLNRQQQSLDYNGLESRKQMRERLQMHLPGEQVFIFVDENQTSSTPAATTSKGNTTTTPRNMKENTAPAEEN